MTHPTLEHGRKALVVAALLAGALLAHGAAAQTPKADATRYRNDVQACRSGQTGQDQDSCLKEARNALAASRNGQLTTDTDALQQNRLQRCQFQTGEARLACIARMSGRGATSGDVASGGILREVETVVVPTGSGPVVIEPKTADPVILVPIKR